jgi:hypothetical protein
VQLKRVSEADDEKRSGAKATTRRAKADTKAQAKRVAERDRAEAKRRRKPERQLNKGLSARPDDAEVDAAPIGRRVIGWLVFIAVIVGLAYVVATGR